MPIFVQTITKRMAAKLDAEGSDRYMFDQDFKPAINEAIEQVVTIFNQAFGENKLTPEVLRELVKIKVWQTNMYSRVSMNPADMGHPLWSIIAVYPEPKLNKGVSGSLEVDQSKSKIRKDISFISSEKSAKRLTHEEWNQNSKNVFMPGNTILQGELKEYAYLDFGDYTSNSYLGLPSKIEITIRPELKQKLVAIAYLKYPNQVTLIGDSIEFPESLTNLMVDMALKNMSYKQGDSTNLFSVTTQNIATIVNLIK
jgi:hypothetical protein